MKRWLLGFFAVTSLTAQQPTYSPQLINQELSQADKDLARAQKMFNPWYTGPILAGSASMLPPGLINIQPYFFVQDNYAAYNNRRKSIDQPDIWQVNPNFVLQTGITSWLDIAATPSFFSNNQHSQWATNFGDLPVLLGFKIADEGVNIPKMKVTINETFPTGNYQYLDGAKQGLDATGSGSYITGFSFRMSKHLFVKTVHPVAARMVLTYNIPSTVHVHSFNTYGGGVGTNGKVRPGNSFNADVGLEWSINQKWAVATDIVYQTNNRTKFNGTPGINPLTGLENKIGSGSSDFLQIAPGIEYNWNDSLGIIGGAWFTVYGRNASNFVNYVLSICYTFSVK